MLSRSPAWRKRAAGSVPDCEQAGMCDIQILESSSDPIWTMRASWPSFVYRVGGGLRMDPEEKRVSELRLERRRDGWHLAGPGSHLAVAVDRATLVPSLSVTNRVCHGDWQEKQEKKRLWKQSRRGSSFSTTHTRIQKYARYFYVPNQHQTASPVKRIARVASQYSQGCTNCRYGRVRVLYGLFD